MAILPLILLVFSFVFFVVAAAGVPSPPRFQFVAAGLACWVASVIVTMHPL